jgi:hypothetical protein
MTPLEQKRCACRREHLKRRSMARCAYSPILRGLIGPADARAVLDLLKRPDCVAQAQVQQAAVESLRALLNFEGTGYWDAVRAAKVHGLDVVSAPSSDARHFLR